ncbi:cycloisomaltooligosaccharide glucanotransferase precursor [mine drainage metagenome]|uniref:Cycloisomaltooligosaccharide glucanotransferase n=1 Tax=mine drainage metagenome TaxID=410659 RepID=A0A1J5PIZ4_9ZZZZ
MAAAKAGNEAAVLQAISSVYRPATLFLTNKENFVNSTGDFAGTQINSSNMLWSLSGNIAIVYKIFFGIQYEENAISFHPFVPQALAGIRELNHFKYREADLNIEESGYGDKIELFTLDGVKLNEPQIPASLQGHHKIKIVLHDDHVDGKKEITRDYTTVETPLVTLDKGYLRWPKIEGAVNYQLLKDGKNLSVVSKTSVLINKAQFGEYQVLALDKYAVPSFASEPVDVFPENCLLKIEAEKNTQPSTMQLSGFSGTGFVEISRTANPVLSIPVQIDHAGTYAINFRYSNGNGPVNTENKCAIRSLSVDRTFSGVVVLPQRGKGEWSNWGFTNEVHVKLKKGKHILKLELAGANANMNGEINQAMIDYVRLIKIF